MSQTTEKLRGILIQMNIHPHIKEIPETENLFTAGVLDSLTLIQFVLAIEDMFQIRINNEDISYDQFQSLQKIAELLKNKHSISNS